MNRSLIFGFVFMLFMKSHCFAAAFDNVEWGLFELRMAGLKMNVVESDMRLYIGREDFYENREQASEDALKRLKQVRSEIDDLRLDPQITSIKLSLEDSILRLETLYKDLHKKDQTQIDHEVEAYFDQEQRYSDLLVDHMKKRSPFPKAPDDLDLLKEDLKSFKNEKDKKAFLDANALVDADKMTLGLMLNRDAAFLTYKRLYKKYKGTSIEGLILYRLIHVSEKMEAEESKVRNSDALAHAKQIKEFFDKGQYSNVLYPLYVLWVPLEQMSNGMSNMSEIPNDLYLDVRWRLVNIIQDHLKTHPNDDWARVQVLLLMEEPIISRDCGPTCEYGNSAYEWITRSFL